VLNRLLLADSGMTNPSLLRGAQTGDGQPTSPAAGVVPILKQIGEGQLKVVGTGFFVNPLVQKSLDVVRVIGNEAVHPGVMDLKMTETRRQSSLS
jgi:hypothetical protein